MNEVDARAVPVYGGYQGEIRKVHRSSYEAVCVNGVPQVYATEAEAEIAAWRALRSHLCGDIVGDGTKAATADFDRIKKVFPGHGRRPFEVEVR